MLTKSNAIWFMIKDFPDFLQRRTRSNCIEDISEIKAISNSVDCTMIAEKSFISNSIFTDLNLNFFYNWNG